MSKQHKRADPQATKRGSSGAEEGPDVASRLRRDARVQGLANKFHEKKAEARRKLPSGPLGGSGRKTNVSRSS